MTLLIVFLVGIYVGWHVPQPDWAKNLPGKAKALLSRKWHS